MALGESGQYIVSRTYYDEMGRAYLTEGPFFASADTYPQAAPAGAPWAQTIFDDYGRPESMEVPDGTHVTVTTTFAYSSFDSRLGSVSSRIGWMPLTAGHLSDLTKLACTYGF